MVGLYALLPVMLVLGPGPAAPGKTRRALLSDAARDLARERIATRADAAALRDRIVSEAQRWLAPPHEELTWRIPDSRVPRAFDASANGSPTIGREIYQRGTYPWIIDFDRPFTLRCPITDQVFPSNDFLAYYRGGLTDRGLLTGEFADDGWGWVAPDGEKYWLVAHANHQYWQKFIVPGTVRLAEAWQLTGDPRFAHRAAAMLARIADIYPAMDHEHQSRYGSLHPGYTGKVLNRIWETNLIESLARAYDFVWETIDTDAELQRLRGQSGPEIRATIERGLLREGIDSVLSHKIRGNYGMHQQALATLVAVAQPPDGRQLLGRTLDDTGAGALDEGIRWALYNWVHRDGVPFETAPGYNLIWTTELTNLASLLEPAGVDLWSEPQFRRLVEWPGEIVIAGRFTPALGDSGNLAHALVGRNADVWRPLAARGVGRYSGWLLAESGGAEPTLTSFAALTSPEPPAVDPTPPRRRSRVLDGYGLALLTNPAETVALSCYYGQRGGHGHRDGLHLDLYAHGRPVTPDTGYPDAMNDQVPGIYSWSKATVCHNTVTIDARQQDGNEGGQVMGFVADRGVQFVDLAAPGCYRQAEEYRRQLLLVSDSDEDAYLVDVVRVTGGGQHDYSLHGTVGARSIVRGEFGPPQAGGTLAGETVGVGEFHDDPVLGAPGYRGGFGRYLGSGFQHLVNVRRQTVPGEVVTEVVPSAEPVVRLRLHHPAGQGQVILAEAQVSPVQHRELLPYTIVRRTGEHLRSTFVTVLEPYRETPLIERVERIDAGDDVLLRVIRPGGVDTIRIGAAPSAVEIGRADATWRWSTATDAGGTVAAVDPVANTLLVRDLEATAEELAGAHVTVVGATRRVFRVQSAAVADGGLRLTLDASLRCGRIRVTGADEATRTVTTDTRLMFQPRYAGMWLTAADGGGAVPIVGCSGGTFQLGGPPPAGAEAWVQAVGVGERLQLPRPRQ